MGLRICQIIFAWLSIVKDDKVHIVGTMHGFRKETRVWIPLENHKTIGFLSNTGLAPLYFHKATKLAFNVGPALAHQWNAFKLAFVGGPMMAHF